MKFSIKDFFSKCDQIRRNLKKYLLENFIFRVAKDTTLVRLTGYTSSVKLSTKVNPCLKETLVTFAYKSLFMEIFMQNMFTCYYVMYLPVSKVFFSYLKRKVAKTKQSYNLSKNANR